MTDRTKPPSDKLMGKVVAKWAGHDESTHFDNGMFYYEPHKYLECVEFICKDPRSDTDAALELLCEICERQWWIIESTEDRGWEILPVDFDSNDQVKAAIPISGQPFRTAVCWLAVDVMGVEHD
jgi:hypothetical protein